MPNVDATCISVEAIPDELREPEQGLRMAEPLQMVCLDRHFHCL